MKRLNALWHILSIMTECAHIRHQFIMQFQDLYMPSDLFSFIKRFLLKSDPESLVCPSGILIDIDLRNKLVESIYEFTLLILLSLIRIERFDHIGEDSVELILQLLYRNGLTLLFICMSIYALMHS